MVHKTGLGVSEFSVQSGGVGHAVALGLAFQGDVNFWRYLWRTTFR